MIRNDPSSVFYPTKAAQFDGINDYMSKSSAIISSYSAGICSFWVKKNIATNAGQVLQAIDSAGSPTAGSVISIDINNNAFTVFIAETGTSNLRRIRTTAAGLNNTNWNHVAFSWNFPGTLATLVINGVVFSVSFTFISGIVTVNNPTNWYFGADSSGGNKMAADISEFYFETGTYLDLSTLSNIRKFLSATRRPVSLGSNGSIPISTQPSLYFKGSGSGFNVNSGSGGDFTTTGTLTTSTTTPSAP